MPRRLLVALLAALALCFLPGCSLLGLAVGSQIPRYQLIDHVTPGDALYVQMDDGEIVRGAAVVVRPAAVTVLADDHERVLATSRMKKIARRHGNEWLSTFIIGLVVDAAIGGFAAVGLAARH